MSQAVQAETGFAEVSGGLLYYEVAGDGPALVLLHEGIVDSRMYDDQFGPLAQHYRVVRYDLHGFGRSKTPQRSYTHHEALRGLLDHLGIERAALLGMSQGGAVALDFALTFPGRVTALLLLASGIGGYPPSEEMLALAAPLIAAFKAGDFVRAIDLTVRFWVDGPARGSDDVYPAVRERVRAMYTDVLRRSRDGDKPAEWLDPPACGRLGDIHVPTLVVVGSGDVPDILGAADLLERSIPGARKLVLPGLAHLLNMERPAEVNDIVLAFLAECYSSTSRTM